MFAYSPTKGNPNTSAVGKFLGKPSLFWADLRSLFDYMVSDLDDSMKQSLLEKFMKDEEVCNTTRKRAKLKSIETAYEFGFKYPKWVLQVKLLLCLCVFFLSFLFLFFFSFSLGPSQVHENCGV